MQMGTTCGSDAWEDIVMISLKILDYHNYISYSYFIVKFTNSFSIYDRSYHTYCIYKMDGC